MKLVERFGVEPQASYRGFVKHPEEFIELLQRGVYTDFVENEPGVPRPLAVSVQRREGDRQLRFKLWLDGIFSPELERLRSLAHRTVQEEAHLAGLERAQSTYAGKHGHSMAVPNQAAIARQGHVLVSIGGDFYTGTELMRIEGTQTIIDAVTQRRQQRTSLITMLDVLLPDYAFIANWIVEELYYPKLTSYVPGPLPGAITRSDTVDKVPTRPQQAEQNGSYAF